MSIAVLSTVAELRAAVAERRAQGASIALVPTMGALHGGHLSLVDAARRAHDVVVVSVFVNPTQFSDAEDFARYPRDLARDRALLEGGGVDVVFAPTISDLYPEPDVGVAVDPGPIGELLEGASRPGHFRGVATVVTKLLSAARPDAAYFGEKDYQQLLVIRHLARALLSGVEIVAGPTVREPDGLALSSRNVRLDPAERAAAVVLSAALRAGAELLLRGGGFAAAEQEMAAVVAAESKASLDYAVVRDAETLLDEGSGPKRLLIAARIGPVRLIDNADPAALAGAD